MQDTNDTWFPGRLPACALARPPPRLSDELPISRDCDYTLFEELCLHRMFERVLRVLDARLMRSSAELAEPLGHLSLLQIAVTERRAYPKCAPRARSEPYKGPDKKCP
jgi:hypothetical protein